VDLGTLVRPKKKELNLNLDYYLGINKRQKNAATKTWPVITFDKYSQVNVQVPHLFSFAKNKRNIFCML